MPCMAYFVMKRTRHVELDEVNRKSVNYTNTAKQSSLKYGYLSL
jgi:hypothetical protein